MQRVILDTNVIVSALISNGIPTNILFEHALPNRITICLSEEVFTEYVEVLGRAKFDRFLSFKRNAEIVLHTLSRLGTFFHPSRRVTLLSDLSDNKFLELAIASNADYLLTGNTQDFTITEFEGTKICSPREYWETNLDI